MKANNFKFESATLAYGGNRKCSQFFNFRGISTIMGVLDTIQEQWCGGRYKNRLDICLSYGDVKVALFIDFDNNTEVYVLADKDVRLPLTDKTEMFIESFMRTYICHENEFGELDWNEHAEEVKEAEKVKVSKFKYIKAEMLLQGGYVIHQEFNFAGDSLLSDVIMSALSTCYAKQDRRKLEINLGYGTANILINVYFEKHIKVYAEADKDTYVPITLVTEQLLEAGKDTYICCVNHEGVYDTMGDVVEAIEAKEAVEAKDDTRSYNVGASDYAQHEIQPWDIWRIYKLNPWDADIVKRVLRTKETDGRKLDYEKIIHICKERIRQIETYGE